jgi:hypothetical protein
VETALKHFKQTMKMDVLKCKHVEGVLKELTVYAMVYNMVSLVMAESARRQEVAAHRISFVDALRWLLDSKGGERVGPTESETRTFRSSGTACLQAAAEGISSDEKTTL